MGSDMNNEIKSGRMYEPKPTEPNKGMSRRSFMRLGAAAVVGFTGVADVANGIEKGVALLNRRTTSQVDQNRPPIVELAQPGETITPAAIPTVELTSTQSQALVGLLEGANVQNLDQLAFKIPLSVGADGNFVSPFGQEPVTVAGQDFFGLNPVTNFIRQSARPDGTTPWMATVIINKDQFNPAENMQTVSIVYEAAEVTPLIDREDPTVQPGTLVWLDPVNTFGYVETLPGQPEIINKIHCVDEATLDYLQATYPQYTFDTTIGNYVAVQLNSQTGYVHGIARSDNNKFIYLNSPEPQTVYKITGSAESNIRPTPGTEQTPVGTVGDGFEAVTGSTIFDKRGQQALQEFLSRGNWPVQENENGLKMVNNWYLVHRNNGSTGHTFGWVRNDVGFPVLESAPAAPFPSGREIIQGQAPESPFLSMSQAELRQIAQNAERLKIIEDVALNRIDRMPSVDSPFIDQLTLYPVLLEVPREKTITLDIYDVNRNRVSQSVDVYAAYVILQDQNSQYFVTEVYFRTSQLIFSPVPNGNIQSGQRGSSVSSAPAFAEMVNRGNYVGQQIEIVLAPIQPGKEEEVVNDPSFRGIAEVQWNRFMQSAFPQGIHQLYNPTNPSIITGTTAQLGPVFQVGLASK